MISCTNPSSNSSFHPRQPRFAVKARTYRFLIVSFMLLLSIVGGTFLTFNLAAPKVAHAAANTAVLTYKNDDHRTGQNTNETTLNHSNVNATQFGRRVKYPVDGQVYAQPLFVPNLTVNGTTHNVVFVVTEHDSVYAFDADATTPVAPLWHTSYLTNGATTVSTTDVSCNDLSPEIGISGTPVIDITSNAMYLVTFTKENGHLVYRLHVLDITTGLDKAGSPTTIQGSAKNTSGTTIHFDPTHERQRAALLIADGHVYMSFASFCDRSPYHGWIMSYSYTNGQIHQDAIYNDTVNGDKAGIWGAGNALASDNSGFIYTLTGNGTFDLNHGGPDAGDTFLKLNSQLQVVDYFTPFNASCLEQGDADLGSGGPLLIPSRGEEIGGGKEGRIYTVTTSSMGHFTAEANLNCGSATSIDNTHVDHIKQELPPKTVGGLFSTPVYWNNTVFFTGIHDHIKAFSFNFATGLLSNSPTSQSAETSVGAIVSSNGTDGSTAILWSIDRTINALRAYDATNLGHELYNSSQNASRDSLDSAIKFSVPMEVNGEVFVGTATSLNIYGLLSTTSPTPTPTSSVTPTPSPTPNPNGYNNVGTSDDGNPGQGNFDTINSSYSAQALQAAGLTPGATVQVYGTAFTWPNVNPGSANNYIAQGQVLPITPVTNAGTLAFLGAAANGATSGTMTLTYTDNSTQNVPIGFDDWTLSGGSASLSSDLIAASTPYRNTPHGKQTLNTYVFYNEVALQAGKTLQSVTLPTNTTGGQMHIFAVSTRAGAPYATTPYTNIGTSSDTAPGTGNFDTTNNSYSAQALQQAAIQPGSVVTTNGTNFIWPAAVAGASNNYVAQGQTIPVNANSGATTLAFLGAASNGAASGDVKITYTDGTTQTVPVSFSDWTLSGGTAQPSAGNAIVATLPYRNHPGGKHTVNTYVFYIAVTLQYSSKTVQSVTLPSTITGGQMHVFSVATH